MDLSIGHADCDFKLMIGERVSIGDDLAEENSAFPAGDGKWSSFGVDQSEQQ